jgi:hypothetical protein
MEFKINKDYLNWCPRLNREDYERLEKSIKKSGINTELHVLSDGTILCGHTRYEIAKKLDISDKDIPYKIVDIPEEYDRIHYLIDDNISRRQLNLAQKIQLGTQLEEVEKAKAQERLQQSGEKFGKGMEKFPHPINDVGTTRDKVGERLGISGRTYEMGKKVMKEKPEEFKKALNGEISIGKSYLELQNERNQKKIQEYKDWLETINIDSDAQTKLNELNFKYLDTGIEFSDDLIQSLTNFEYITQEDYEGDKEINVARILRIDGYEEEKEEFIERIRASILMMKEAIKSCEKIVEYYNGSK